MGVRRFEGAVVPILLFALALLSPIGVTTGVSGTGEINQRLVAPVWIFNLSGPLTGVLDPDLTWLDLTGLDFLSQLLLAFVASLYYLGLGNRKVVVLSGLVSPFVYMRCCLSSLWGPGWWTHYPIPAMLVIVVVMTIVFPASRKTGHPAPRGPEASNLKDPPSSESAAISHRTSRNGIRSGIMACRTCC